MVKLLIGTYILSMVVAASSFFYVNNHLYPDSHFAIVFFNSILLMAGFAMSAIIFGAGLVYKHPKFNEEIYHHLRPSEAHLLKSAEIGYHPSSRVFSWNMMVFCVYLPFMYGYVPTNDWFGIFLSTLSAFLASYGVHMCLYTYYYDMLNAVENQ